MRVLVINCGSATLKYKLFEERGGELELLAGATVEIEGGYRAAVERAMAALPAPPDVIAASGRARRRPSARGDPHRRRGAPDPARGHPAGAAAQRPGARGDRGDARGGGAAGRRAGYGLSRAACRRGPGATPSPSSPGVRRYGFHGWSHRYVTERYATWPAPRSPPSSRSTSAAAAPPPPFSAGDRWTRRWVTRRSRAW